MGLMTMSVYQIHGQIKSNNEIELNQWIIQRNKFLISDDSPLNLIGILTVKAGNQTFGSAKDNGVIFPSDEVPAKFGSVTLEDGQINVHINDGYPVRIKGELITEDKIFNPRLEKPVFEYRSFRWYFTENNGEYAVRILDTASTYRQHFKGVKRFPVDLHWQFKGHFTPYEENVTIPITTVLGITNQRPAAGLISFEYEGNTYQLEALNQAGKLFVTFSDLTGNNESYAFRFLTIERPVGTNDIWIDFNRAINPNCAFSPFAPCPLPPAKNNLPLAVKAGELKYVTNKENK
ncbi:hypothetical protein SAMN05216436_11489 [bacterium A37T11]|nr:hypothetical protein SAMN05216436_11489 [bacterium A37T11]